MNRAFAVACFSFVTGVVSAGAALAQSGPLSEAEVEKLIVGNTVKGPIGAQPYSFYYHPDGKVDGVIGAGNNDSGTWKFQGSDTFCFEWIDFFDGVEHCYQWYRHGADRYVMKNRDVDRSRNINVWSIEPGNPLGF